MENRYELNKNLAQMLKGGVIMDVTTPEQAKIAEAAGASAVMALERIPADIRAAGGVSRMSDPAMIKGIQNAVSIPVMAKCRIGHFTEAQILPSLCAPSTKKNRDRASKQHKIKTKPLPIWTNGYVSFTPLLKLRWKTNLSC